MKCSVCHAVQEKRVEQLLYVYARDEAEAMAVVQKADPADELINGQSPLDYELDNGPDHDWICGFETETGNAVDVTAEMVDNIHGIDDSWLGEESLPWGMLGGESPGITEFFEKFGGVLTLDRSGYIVEPKE